MRISDVKSMTNHELVFELADVYAGICLNYMGGKATQQLSKQLNTLTDELIKRDLLTEQEKQKLNM